MKKRFFAIFAVFPLVLGGCSLKDGLSAIKGGIDNLKKNVSSLFGKKGDEDKPLEGNDNSSTPSSGDNGGTTTPTDPVTPPEEQWEKVYVTNAFEHWYEDENGSTIREPHHFEVVAESAATCHEHSHQVLRCLECEYEKFVEGDSYLEHRYSSRITKVAKCNEEGDITFICDLCGDTFVQHYSEPNAHNFLLDSDTGSVKTYHCEHCNEIKKVVDCASSQAAEVSNSDLQEAGEVQLEHAAIAFDEDTLQDFDEDVTIAAEPKTTAQVMEGEEGIALTEEEQEKLEGKQIIDLSVTKTESDEKISEFSGSVKVTLPYTLQPGEEANGIAIWYLGENGAEAIKAEYLDGFVSFETTHFSYYAVVHLDPEEVCRSFGHELLAGQRVESTCAVHGYEDKICRRCHKTERKTLPLDEHHYEFLDKKDATTTSTGYVRYQCSVCEKIDERVIPMLESNLDESFYINFVKSLLTPDFQIETNATLNGENESFGLTMGLDYDGQFFEYFSNDSSPYMSSSFTYKGYHYNNYTNKSEYQDSITAIMNMISLVVDYVPNRYKELFDDLASWLFEKYLVREESPEGYTFTLNKVAFRETIELLAHAKLSVAIPGIIGQENYNKVLGFLEDHYSDTVGEFVDYLESQGFLISELNTAISNIFEVLGLPAGNVPNIAAILEEVENVPLTTVLEQLLQMLMRGGGMSSGSSEGHVEPKPDTEPLRGKEDEEGVRPDPESGEENQGQEGQGGLFPSTYAEFKEIIDQYLDLNLIDLILGVAGVSEESLFNKEVILGYVDLALDTIDSEKAKFELKTTTAGSFISIEFSVRDLLIEIPEQEDENIEMAYAKITKIFDKGEALRVLDQKLDQFDIAFNAFNLSETNYEWFSKPIEDYFKRSYPSFKLSYIPMDSDSLSSKGALVSNVKIRLQTSSYMDNGVIYPEYGEGKLVIALDNADPQVYLDMYNQTHEEWYLHEYQYYVNRSRGDIVQNRDGLGTVLGKNEVGLETHFNNLVSFAYLQQDSTSVDELVSNYHIPLEALPRFGVLFNVNTHKYSVSDYYGSFSYLNSYYYDYVPTELVSKEEYLEYIGGLDHHSPGKEFDLDNCYFVKMVSENNDRYYINYVEKSYAESWQQTVHLHDPSMNDKALEHITTFQISYVIRDEQIVRTARLRSGLPFDDYFKEYGNNLFDHSQYQHREIYYQYLGRDEHGHIDASKGKDYSYSISFGNVSASYKATRTSLDCVRNVSLRISVNGQVIVSENHQAHQDIHEWITTEEISRTPISTCEDRVNMNEKCSKCNKVLRDYYTTSSHHHLTSHTHTENPTLTCYGYSYSYDTCDNCDYIDYYNFRTIHPCSHNNAVWDEESHILHCPDCGYEVESENGQVPELIYEEYGRENGSITYTVYSPRLGNWGYSISSLNYYYDFYLVVGYKDSESGEFVTLFDREELNGANLRFSALPMSNAYIDRYEMDDYYLAFTLTFDEAGYESLLIEHPEASATIVAVAKDTGTIFMYQI